MNKKGKEYVKTSNIIKLEKEIQLLHRKLAHIRKNYLHQTTAEIVKTKPFKVVVEDINIIKDIMKNKHLSKVITKQEFYKFRRMMEYKRRVLGIKL